MSNFFDGAGKLQKQHDRGGARTSVLQGYNLTLYHCARLSYINTQSFNAKYKKRRYSCLHHRPPGWKCKSIPNRKFELPYL